MSSFIEVCKMNDLFIKVAEKPTFHNYHSENNHRYMKYKMLTFSGLDHAPLSHRLENWFGALGLNIASLDLDFDFSDIVFLSFPLVLSADL